MMYVLASQTGVNCRRLNNNMKDELFFDINLYGSLKLNHIMVYTVAIRYSRRIGMSTLKEV